MDKTSNINLSMLFDFYELTMGNGYFQNNMEMRSLILMYSTVPSRTREASPLPQVWNR